MEDGDPKREPPGRAHEPRLFSAIPARPDCLMANLGGLLMIL
jgi:hypothetical protein